MTPVADSDPQRQDTGSVDSYSEPPAAESASGLSSAVDVSDDRESPSLEETGGNGKSHRYRSMVRLGVHEVSAALYGHWQVLLLATAVTVASWAPSLTAPTEGLDPSWRTALAEVLQQRIQFGPRVIFSYGPLGALASPVLFSGSIAAASIAFLALTTWLLAFLLLISLRQNFNLLASTFLTYLIVSLVTALVDPGDLGYAPGLLLALLIARLPSSHRRTAAIAVLASFGALELLIKFGVGVCLLICLLFVAVLNGDRRRSVVVATVSFFATFLVLWVSIGQAVGHIPSYLSRSISLSTGYTAAMNISANASIPSRGSENWYALVDLVMLAAIAAFALAARSRVERWSCALVLGAWSWFVLKEGYVRHDSHDVIFLALLLPVLVWAKVPSRSRSLMVGAVALSVLMTLSAAGRVPHQLLSPVGNVARVATDVRDVLDGSRRQELITADRATLGSHLLPGSILDDLRGHTVAVDPYEDSIAWIYPDLHWVPEPVLQSYAAYTSSLDKMDADFFASADAPQRLLRSIGSIDNRFAYLDPPALQLSFICNYRQVAVVDTWQVLAKVPNRCGRPVPDGRTSAAFGHPLEVPPSRPNSITVASLDVPATLLARVEDLVLKAPQYAISLTYGGQDHQFRYIAGTSGDLHVLFVPSTSGYASPFLTPAIQGLSISGGGWSSGEGRVSATFYSIPLEPS